MKNKLKQYLNEELVNIDYKKVKKMLISIEKEIKSFKKELEQVTIEDFQKESAEKFMLEELEKVKDDIIRIKGNFIF